MKKLTIEITDEPVGLPSPTHCCSGLPKSQEQMESETRHWEEHDRGRSFIRVHAFGLDDYHKMAIANFPSITIHATYKTGSSSGREVAMRRVTEALLEFILEFNGADASPYKYFDPKSVWVTDLEQLA